MGGRCYLNKNLTIMWSRIDLNYDPSYDFLLKFENLVDKWEFIL